MDHILLSLVLLCCKRACKHKISANTLRSMVKACHPIPLPTIVWYLTWITTCCLCVSPHVIELFHRCSLVCPSQCYCCTHGCHKRTLDNPIQFVDYCTFIPQQLACASTRATDIQTRKTDSANVCSGESNQEMLLARLPLCLPEQGDAQKGGALAHAMAQTLQKTATASPLGLLEEQTCPAGVHEVCGIHG